jgi:hypothetical protein
VLTSAAMDFSERLCVPPPYLHHSPPCAVLCCIPIPLCLGHPLHWAHLTSVTPLKLTYSIHIRVVVKPSRTRCVSLAS